MVDVLRVYCGEQHVGDLHRHPDERMAFSYALTWLDDRRSFAISASLPLVRGLNSTPAAHAFFANLLPEGALREAVARQLGVSSSNDFVLLEAIGGECAGALTLLPGDTTPDPTLEGYEPLEPEVVAEMARRFSVLPEIASRKPRLSLAGAQDKLPVRRDDDGSLWLPTGGAASTHILKVPSRDFRHLPANEVLVTKLARELGLVAVDAELIVIEGVEIAVVRRYDRVVGVDGIIRLHQEDLCQALGLMPGSKYEREGGPTFADAIRVARERSVAPLVDAQQLLRWLVFNLLAGNADGHGKNLSHLLAPAGERLAPFYDLVCTRAYPHIDRSLAMGIGGETDPGQIGRGHWESLATQINVGPRFIFRQIEELATKMTMELDRVSEDKALGKAPVIGKIRQVIRRQCRRTLRLLGE